MVAWNFVERTQPHSGAAHATKLRSVSQHAKPHPPNTQKGKEDKETPTGRKEQLGRGEGPTGAPLRRGQLYSGTGGTSGQRPIDGGFDDDDVYYYIRWRVKLEGETDALIHCEVKVGSRSMKMMKDMVMFVLRERERRWVLLKIPRCDIDEVGEGK